MLPSKFDSFFALAEKENLYNQLIAQINKDFSRARIPLELSANTIPVVLKKSIQGKIRILIQQNFTEYLNLLYIIDVPEKKIKDINSDDLEQLSEEVTFLILKREWLKVWYKNNY